MVPIVPNRKIASHDLCSLEELVAASPKVFQFQHPVQGVHDIAVFWEKSRAYALEGSCPHQRASLAYGHIADGTVICPLHHAIFDLDSGRCLDGFTNDSITYEVLIKNGRVSIMVPEEILVL
jgi:nitrite reductase/ring-hydroxylating ferredoxin subunit